MENILEQALNELEAAKSRFNLASGAEEVEIACMELAAAELKLRAVIRRAKIGEKENRDRVQVMAYQ